MMEQPSKLNTPLIFSVYPSCDARDKLERIFESFSDDKRNAIMQEFEATMEQHSRE